LRIALVAAVAAGLASPAVSAPAQTDLTLRASWLPFAPHIPYYLGRAKGWFKEAGINLHIEHSKGSVAAISLVGSGQGDVAVAGLDSMALAHSKGVPVIAISSIYRKNEFGICFDKGKPYRKASDFIGKEVIFTATSSEAPFIDTFLASAGVKRSSVKLLAVDAAAKYSSFVGGKGDAVGGAVPYCHATMTGIRNVDCLLFADFGMPMLSDGMIANEAAVKNKPEALKAFNKVVAKSWAYVLESEDHVTEACQSMVDARPQDRLSVKECKSVFEAYRPFLYSEATKGHSIGYQAPVDWENTIETLKKLKLISGNMKPSEFYTTEFGPEK
jgi:NitT/TauT family transport system substrate-binding protein